MAKKKIDKTNAMRILDRSKIPYEIMTYTVDESDLSGEHAAAELGLDPERVFKTLVLKGDKKGYLVAVIPVNATLDLKALARVSGNKSVEMIHVKELFDLTGYIRGGCSPIGMKKLFPTDTIVFSAGQRGMQIVLPHADLVKAIGAEICSIIQE